MSKRMLMKFTAMLSAAAIMTSGLTVTASAAQTNAEQIDAAHTIIESGAEANTKVSGDSDTDYNDYNYFNSDTDYNDYNYFDSDTDYNYFDSDIDFDTDILPNENRADLTEITVPSEIDGHKVTWIRDRAFEGCTSLKSITIPETVTEIDSGAFYDCISLEKIEVSSDNQSFTSVDGVLYTKDKSTLLWVPKKLSAKKVTIPAQCVNDNKYICNYEVWASTPSHGITIANGSSAYNNANQWIHGASIFTGFSESESIESIEVEEGNPIYSSYDGAVYYKPEVKIDNSDTDTGNRYEDYAHTDVPNIPDYIETDTDEFGSPETGPDKYECGLYIVPRGKKSIEISPDADKILNTVAAYAPNLEEIEVAEGNKYFTADDGVLYSKSKTTMMAVPAKKKTLNIPAETNFLTFIPAYSHRSVSETEVTYNIFALESITVDSNNKRYAAKDGLLYTKDLTALVYCPPMASGDKEVPKEASIEASIRHADTFEAYSTENSVTLNVHYGSEAYWYLKKNKEPYKVIGADESYSGYIESTENAPTGTIKFDSTGWNNSDRILFYIWDETNGMYASNSGWSNEPTWGSKRLRGTLSENEKNIFESYEFSIPEGHDVYLIVHDYNIGLQTIEFKITKEQFGDTAYLTGETAVLPLDTTRIYPTIKFKNTDAYSQKYKVISTYDGNVYGDELLPETSCPNSKHDFIVADFIYVISKNTGERFAPPRKQRRSSKSMSLQPTKCGLSAKS